MSKKASFTSQNYTKCIHVVFLTIAHASWRKRQWHVADLAVAELGQNTGTNRRSCDPVSLSQEFCPGRRPTAQILGTSSGQEVAGQVGIGGHRWA